MTPLETLRCGLTAPHLLLTGELLLCAGLMAVGGYLMRGAPRPAKTPWGRRLRRWGLEWLAPLMLMSVGILLLCGVGGERMDRLQSALEADLVVWLFPAMYAGDDPSLEDATALADPDARLDRARSAAGLPLHACSSDPRENAP